MDSERLVASYLWLRYGSAHLKMKRYFSLVEDAGRKMFTSPGGEFGNLNAVREARDALVSAQQELFLSMQAADQPQAKFMINALMINHTYALADIDVSYYQLLSDPARTAEAKEKLRVLINTNRFTGVILQCIYSIRRHDPSVVRASLEWVYQDYRGALGKAAGKRTQASPGADVQGKGTDSDEVLKPFEDQAPPL